MQCPGEGPAPLGELDAPLVGMQPRAPAGDAPTRITNGFATRTRHDAEQLGGPAPGAQCRPPMHVRMGRCTVTAAGSFADSGDVDGAAAIGQSPPRCPEWPI